MSKPSRAALAQAATAKLLADPARAREIMRSTAAFLIENGMVEDADLIINDIAHELFLSNGQLTVEVTTASALSAAARQEIEAYLKRQTGARLVFLHESVDPDLIGGLKARTPDAELDVSVRTQLRKLAALA